MTAAGWYVQATHEGCALAGHKRGDRCAQGGNHFSHLGIDVYEEEGPLFFGDPIAVGALFDAIDTHCPLASRDLGGQLGS